MILLEHRTYLPISLLIMPSTIIIVGVKFNEDFIHLTMLMCQKWALCWVLVDLTRKHLCRTREKNSEGKWAIDWAAECITYQRLSLVPRRFRLGHSWTLPWAVTSPRDTRLALSPALSQTSRGQRIKRERLGTRLPTTKFRTLFLSSVSLYQTFK